MLFIYYDKLFDMIAGRCFYVCLLEDFEIEYNKWKLKNL